MDPSWAPASEGRAKEAWSQILRPLAAQLRSEARPLSEVAVARMYAAVPSLFADPAMVEQTRTSAEAVYAEIAESIASGADPGRIELPPWVVAGAQDRARRGAPVLDLMRVIWLGREVLWEWAFDQIGRRAPERRRADAASQLCSAWIYAAIDRVVTLYTEIYAAERERWQLRAGITRKETIEAILDRREHDSARASAQLRYELGRHHLAVVAWIDENTGREPGDQLDAGIAHVAESLHADGSLVEPLSMLALRAWISRATPFDEAELQALRPRPGAPSDVRLALGEPGTGIEAFRQSHLEAQHARRVASMLGTSRGTVTRFSRVELAAVGTADVDLARLFVARTLGDLAAGDDNTRRLASTLRVYLEENSSRPRTAKRLGIHANTVSYRVRQAEAMLGQPVASNPAKLMLALALAPALGSSQPDRPV